MLLLKEADSRAFMKSLQAHMRPLELTQGTNGMISGSLKLETLVSSRRSSYLQIRPSRSPYTTVGGWGV